ncbi:DUF3991 domain-containing protein [Listeria booriae]|uniref:DUF3991 domain-containing protein n=2 Tax=Listeria booriae TaxID=1552123 RepID=A0A7X1DSR2_9LIST|nr:toprim domain-containing protein [Listeria booriae]MBC2373614.1 DUF3991 domain-containing protein [Listeria booriae]
MRVSKEEIEKASQVDIINYLESIGENVIQQSANHYCLDRHDSLVVNTKINKYTWYSQPESEKMKNGNVINLVQILYGRSFVEAVKELNDPAFIRVDVTERKQQPKQPFVYKAGIESNDRSAIREYLIEERAIDPDIVEQLIEKNLVRQSLDKDVIFLWNREGKIAGADIQGTKKDLQQYKKRGTKKRILANSTSNYGFNITLGKPTKMYCFESPIDLISFWSLNKEKLNHARLVSLSGTKPQAVAQFYHHTIQTRNPELKDVYICTDNDKAGHTVVDFFRQYSLANDQGEVANVVNRIPNDLVIPEHFAETYQRSANEYSIDWRLLAAFHKAESNLGETNQHANADQVELYYSDPIEEKEDIKEIDAEERSKKLAEDIANYITEHQAFTVGAFLYERHERQAPTFVEAFNDYYQHYVQDEYQLAKDIPKDWNDILVAERNKREMDYYLEQDQHQKEALFVQQG